MNFLRIAWRDINSIFKNRIIRVSVIGIIIIPLLYSLLYLAAFWDPYSRLQNVPVAVVNLDKGGTKDSQAVNYGKDVVDKLKKDNQLGWRFVTKEDAESGVKGDKYYAEFIIPENFSEKVLSAKNGKPEQPNIIFSANEKRNFLAAQINGKVEVQLKANIVKTITNEYAAATFDSLYDLKDGLSTATNGSNDLKNGIATARDGSKVLNDGIGQIKSKIPDLATGVNKLADGSSTLESGVNSTAVDSNGNPLGLKNGASQLNSGLATVNNGLSSLNRAVNVGTSGQPSLLSGITQIYGGITNPDSTKGLAAGVGKLNTAVNIDVDAAHPSLKTGISKIYSGITDPTQGLATGVAALNKAVNVDVDAAHPSLKTGISKVYSGITDPTQGLATGVAALNKAVNVDVDAAHPSLKTGISKVYSGITDPTQGLATNVSMLNSLVNDYNTTASATQKSSDLANIMAIIPQLNTAVNVDVDAAHPSLKTGISKIYSGITDPTQGLATGVNTLNTAVNVDVDAAHPSLKTGISKMYSGITDPTQGLATGVSTLNTAVNVDVDAAHPSLKTGISKMYSGITDPTQGLATGVGALNTAVNTGTSTQPSLVSGVTTIYNGITDTKQGLGVSVTALNNGTSKLYTGSNALVTGINTLSDGSVQLKNGLTTLNSSVPQLADGANKLADGSSTLADGMNKLYDGSDKLHSGLSDGSDKLNKNLINSSKDMATFISDPLSISDQAVNPVKNYGSGFAPYFIPLSLWVGALMMFFIITDKVDDDINASSLSLVAGKYLSYGFIGILQAVLVSTVVLTLGLHPTNIVLYYLVNIFMSFAFIAIIQCLVFLLGQVGRALAIVLLILQLTACAGTFPLEVVPNFFKVLNPFMPFTYCVSALREVISATSTDYTILAKDFTILAFGLAVSLVVSVLFKGHADKMKAVIREKNNEANIA